ncbi:MAG TPA: hypothetical protein VNF29_04265 [Candidatus Binataceae bacterium]|nr:hypothetical protein [Candidatus Binataceae bacterium]
MAQSADPPAAAEPLKLDALQRDILLPQIQAFIDATPDPAAREVYVNLKAAADAMEVAPPDLQARLGAIVEVALQSGRIRRLFGPGAELAINALFAKTPRGREITGSIRELNAALARLNGDTVEEVTATLRAPGAYALTLKTSGCQLVIRFEPAGVRVESAEVALG